VGAYQLEKTFDEPTAFGEHLCFPGLEPHQIPVRRLPGTDILPCTAADSSMTALQCFSQFRLPAARHHIRERDR
jgi:hypothetical protein